QPLFLAGQAARQANDESVGNTSQVIDGDGAADAGNAAQAIEGGGDRRGIEGRGAGRRNVARSGVDCAVVEADRERRSGNGGEDQGFDRIGAAELHKRGRIVNDERVVRRGERGRVVVFARDVAGGRVGVDCQDALRDGETERVA